MKRLAPVVLAFTVAACVTPGDPDDGRSAADPELASPGTVDGVGNFAKISEGVWRGEQPTAEGMRTLKKMGVRTIVNLRRMHSDRDELRGCGLRYAHFGATAFDIGDEEIAQFLKVATDPAHRPVFVHCQHGADRTGAAVAAYRVVVQGWTMEKAKRELKRFGYHDVFVNIRAYLDGFDAERVRRRMSTAEAKVEEVP